MYVSDAHIHNPSHITHDPLSLKEIKGSVNVLVNNPAVQTSQNEYVAPFQAFRCVCVCVCVCVCARARVLCVCVCCVLSLSLSVVCFVCVCV